MHLIGDFPELRVDGETLAVVGGMVLSGVIPFAVLSLLFVPFVTTLPLLLITGVLVIIALIAAIVLVVGGIARRMQSSTKKTKTEEYPTSFNALPEEIKEQFFRAKSDKNQPPTLMYGVTLAADGAKIAAIAYGVGLAYVAFGILGVAAATVASGFLAARDHAHLQTITRAYRPVTDDEIVETVEEYSQELGLTTPAVYDAPLDTGPAAAIRVDEDDACILIDKQQIDTFKDDERDAVLVHELAHLAQPFSSKRPIALRPLPLIVVLAVALLFPVSGLAISIMTLLGYVVVRLFLMKRHRQFEHEADTIAADIVGPIPTAVALVRASDVAPLALADNRIVQLAEQFSSHPQTAARIQTLLNDVEANNGRNEPPLPQPIPEWDWSIEDSES